MGMSEEVREGLKIKGNKRQGSRKEIKGEKYMRKRYHVSW